MKSLVRRFADNVQGMREDERGAESSEVILVLVVLVIGLLAAFAVIRNKLSSSSTKISDCIGSANTSTTCANG